jgi:hypothetical protein
MGQETTKKIRLMTRTDIPAVMELDKEAFLSNGLWQPGKKN